MHYALLYICYPDRLEIAVAVRRLRDSKRPSRYSTGAQHIITG
jgi:hypothetical protein